jgi:hypothetical protein
MAAYPCPSTGELSKKNCCQPTHPATPLHAGVENRFVFICTEKELAVPFEFSPVMAEVPNDPVA